MNTNTCTRLGSDAIKNQTRFWRVVLPLHYDQAAALRAASSMQRFCGGLRATPGREEGRWVLRVSFWESDRSQLWRWEEAYCMESARQVQEHKQRSQGMKTRKELSAMTKEQLKELLLSMCPDTPRISSKNKGQLVGAVVRAQKKDAAACERPPMTCEKVSVSFGLTREQREVLRAIAKRKGVYLSELLRGQVLKHTDQLCQAIIDEEGMEEPFVEKRHLDARERRRLRALRQQESRAAKVRQDHESQADKARQEAQEAQEKERQAQDAIEQATTPTRKRAAQRQAKTAGRKAEAAQRKVISLEAKRDEAAARERSAAEAAHALEHECTACADISKRPKASLEEGEMIGPRGSSQMSSSQPSQASSKDAQAAFEADLEAGLKALGL